MPIHDLVRRRLRRDRPMTSITLRMPQDVIDSMKVIAPLRGFTGYQALLRAYVSQGLRRDEAAYLMGPQAQLIEALRRRGVPAELLEETAREVAAEVEPGAGEQTAS